MSGSNKDSKLEGTEKVLDKRTTLLRPPEPDPNKAPIEHTVEVTPLAVLGEVSRQHENHHFSLHPERCYHMKAHHDRYTKHTS